MRCRASQETTTKIGFKWDGSNLRWVRDDRYAGISKNTFIQPKTGPAYTIWPVVHAELTEAGVKSVTAEEAAKLQSQGWVIIDVRVEGDFASQHCEGAVNIPLFRFVQGNELWDQIKKVAMAGFAMKATERDPTFGQKAQSILKKGQKIIVVCSIGGTLDTKLRLRPDKYKDGINDQDRAFGRESRALKACHELLKAGWNGKNMVFMEGGFQQWKHQGFPIDSL